MNNDLNFISGDFLELDLPKEKQYLFKYFDTDIQMQFLRYYYVFGNIDRFMEHTGFFCAKRYLRELIEKYNKLTDTYNRAKESADLEIVAQIQMGKFKI